ncbi:metalloendopeptidase [Pseudogymnoascus australis]
MLFSKFLRPIAAPKRLARCLELRKVLQPRDSLPRHACARSFTRPSFEPWRKIGRGPHSTGSRQQQRVFHESFNTRRRQIFQRIEPHNARPLITPEQVRRLFASGQFRGLIILTAGGMTIFYFMNIETVPVSGRRRFNCFSDESAEQQGQLAYKQILNEEARRGRVLPRSDFRVRRVETVLRRLIEAGDLGTGQSDRKEGEGWTVHVIEDPNQANAFVLPGGKVFVYSGIFPVCRNNDGLAAVMGHEIAHNMAQHSAEKMSQMVLLQPIVLGLMYLDYTGVTFGLGRYLGSMMLDLGIMKVSSREQESEADHIGLMLMASACYDPKAAIGLWQRMEKLDKETPPEWLSTHPSNANRIQQITQLLPEAENKYQESNCAAMGGYNNAFQDVVGRTLVFR